MSLFGGKAPEAALGAEAPRRFLLGLEQCDDAGAQCQKCNCQNCFFWRWPAFKDGFIERQAAF